MSIVHYPDLTKITLKTATSASVRYFHDNSSDLQAEKLTDLNMKLLQLKLSRMINESHKNDDGGCIFLSCCC